MRSARYADEGGSREARDRANNAKLVDALTGIEARDAHYVCVLAMLRGADDPEPIVTFGRWDGRIVEMPAGANGFGYDAHFFLPDLGLTAAELDVETKNRISHRAIAMRELGERLRGRR